jgi:hypothetical protein
MWRMEVVCAVGLDKRARLVEIRVAVGTRWSEASWTGAEERCRGVRRGQRVWGMFVEDRALEWVGGLEGVHGCVMLSGRVEREVEVVEEVTAR